jgi:WD40 repeat protein/serine/threonine protein kinase
MSIENRSAEHVPPPGAPGTGEPDLPFARLGHYEILARLGRGGMGDVYLAYEEALRRQVAVKVLPRELARDAAFVRRFHHEAAAIARLDHPNVVPIYYSGQDAGHHFFVMQYVEGESLAQRLERQGRLAADDALAILERCLAGLEAAHDAGLVHRDVKPANILIEGKTGRVLIADFGLARTTDTSGPTATGQVLGTAEYIAPEQALGQPVDGRTDLYALGGVAYQMLSGRLPFQATTIDSLIYQHAFEPPPSLEKTAPDLSPALARLVMKLLAKDPAQRYQRAAEALAEVRRLRGDRKIADPETSVFVPNDPLAVGIQAGAGAPTPACVGTRQAPEALPPRRPPSRQRRVVALLSVLVAAVLLGGAVYRIQTDHGELVITSESDDVEILIKPGPRVVRIRDAKTGQSVTLPSGSYELELKDVGKGLRLTLDKVTLSRGDKVLARIERVKGDRAAKGPEDADVGKATEVQRFKGYPAERHPGLMALSPNGRILATAASDIQLWDVTTGKKLPTLEGHRTQIQCLAFSPDGKWLASGAAGPDATVRIWDVASGKLEKVCWHAGTEGPGSGWVTGVAFAPDGKTVFSSSFEGSVRQWDVQTGQEVKRFGGKGRYRCLAISPDGRWLASGTSSPPGEPRGIFVWDVASGKEIQRFEGHATPGKIGETILAFSPDGKRILSAGYDPTARVWDIAGGKEVRRLEDCPLAGWGGSVQWAPDGRTLLEVRSDYRGIRRWDVETGKERPGFADPRICGVGARVILLRDGRSVLCVFADNTARLWRLPDPPAPAKAGEVWRYEGHSGNVLGVAFSPDGRRVLSSSSDGTVRLLDAQTGKLLRTMNHPRARSVAFAPDGKRAISTGWGGDGSLRLWDLETCQELKHFYTGWGVHGAAFTPDGRRVLYALPADKTLRLLDLETGQEVKRFEGHAGGVQGYALSADGKRTLSGSVDTTARLWDNETGKELKRLEGHKDQVLCVAFSPDGKRAASAGNEAVIKIWDLETGKEIRQLEGHTALIHGLAFSRDGRRLASASYDKTVRLWDAATGKELYKCEGHTEGVYDVAFSPDGRSLVSGSKDRSVRLWRLPDPPPPENAAAEVIRTFLTKNAEGKLFIGPDAPVVGISRGAGIDKIWYRKSSDHLKAPMPVVTLDEIQMDELDGALAVARVKYHTAAVRCRAVFTLSSEGGEWRIVSWVFETRYPQQP